jgi:hypothetical protein
VGTNVHHSTLFVRDFFLSFVVDDVDFACIIDADLVVAVVPVNTTFVDIILALLLLQVMQGYCSSHIFVA